MSFLQCKSTLFDKKAPISITSSFYNNWVGGIPGVSGVLITIKAKKPEREIIFDSIYFMNKMVKLETRILKNELTLTGNISTSKNKNDLILNADSKKEFGNKLPKFNSEFPFELKDNEAVITYFINSNKRYYKLSNMKKEKSSFYQ